MKKILSLGLVGVMALSMIPTALATTDYTNGTRVEYTANDEANTAYTITVPALLAPGAEGTVKLEGTWASDATVKVTADQTVTLTNSINSADQKVLDVTFAGIEKAGDNTATVTATEAVSVANIENALFGTWSGKFNYNVEMVVEEPIAVLSFRMFREENEMVVEDKTYNFEPGMTWEDWLGSEYNTDNYEIISGFPGCEKDGKTYTMFIFDGKMVGVQCSDIIEEQSYQLVETEF